MKKFLATLALAALAVSCAPSTPQTRIAEHPEKFAKLGAKEKSMVEEGQISRRMSKDAVFLAWGPPSETFDGNDAGKASERWDYNGSRPVYNSGFFGGIGYGYGYGVGYGRYSPYAGYGYPYYPVSPEVTYIPYRKASVWFVGDRVDSWERIR